MYFTEEKIRQILTGSEEMIQKYQNRYRDFKSAVDTNAGYNVIWTEGIAEPFYIGYINDIEDSPERKILKSEPKKKEFRAKHYFKENEPVYSVFYNDKAEAVMEKFFVRNGNIRSGFRYYGNLSQISAEFFDESGKPVEYRSIEIKKPIHQPIEITVECFAYTYENDHIISAEYIRDLNISKPVMMYDNTLYKDWGRDLDYMLKTPPMNPNLTGRYDFIYGEHGSPVEFSRTEYSYCNVKTYQFKARKKVFDRFIKYGIPWFTKQ